MASEESISTLRTCVDTDLSTTNQNQSSSSQREANSFDHQFDGSQQVTGFHCVENKSWTEGPTSIEKDVSDQSNAPYMIKNDSKGSSEARRESDTVERWCNGSDCANVDEEQLRSEHPFDIPEPTTSSKNSWLSEAEYQAKYSRSLLCRTVARTGKMISYDAEERWVAREKAVRDKCKAIVRSTQRRCTNTRLKISEAIFGICPSNCLVVNNRRTLHRLLDRLSALRGRPPRVVLDCEGILNCRVTKNIDTIELYDMEQAIIYLIDMFLLGATAFDFSLRSSNFTLREFLESPQYRKVMWDCRADSFAFFYCYQIKLHGVIDAQLQEVLYRRERYQIYHDHRMSILAASRKYLLWTVSESFMDEIENVKCEMYATVRAWKQRPLTKVHFRYVQDLTLMARLYKLFRKFLKNAPDLDAMIYKETENTIEITWQTEYDADNGGCSFHPWSPL